MNDKDKEAFEKWVDEDSVSQMELRLFAVMSENQKIMFCSKRAFQAALEYERERSKILVEALEKIQTYAEKKRDRELEIMGWQALKKYRGDV